PGAVHQSPRLPPTLDRAFARDPGDAAALAAAPGRGDDRSGGTRQGPPSRGGRTGGGQDRWGAAVCRTRLCAGASALPAGGGHTAALPGAVEAVLLAAGVGAVAASARGGGGTPRRGAAAARPRHVGGGPPRAGECRRMGLGIGSPGHVGGETGPAA